jgi:hypothetical protein
MNSAASQTGAVAPVAFEDGLGERLYAVGAGNEPLEVLKISSELTWVSTFEASLRAQMERLADFRHEAFGRVRAVERMDARSVVIISDHVRGVRLSDVLAGAKKRDILLEFPAAAWLIRQLASALAAFHESGPDVCHGAISPERLVVTPDGRLVLVEYILGPALEEMHFSWERYWRELGIALPRPIGLSRFDPAADVTQMGAVALALLLARPLASDEYPHKVSDVLEQASARSAAGDEPLPAPFRAWLRRTLHLEPRSAYDSGLEAQAELELRLELDDAVGRASLRSFLSRYATAIALERQAAAQEKSEAPASPMPAPAVVESPGIESYGMESSGAEPAAVEPEPEPAVVTETWDGDFPEEAAPSVLEAGDALMSEPAEIPWLEAAPTVESEPAALSDFEPEPVVASVTAAPHAIVDEPQAEEVLPSMPVHAMQEWSPEPSSAPAHDTHVEPVDAPAPVLVSEPAPLAPVAMMAVPVPEPEPVAPVLAVVAPVAAPVATPAPVVQTFKPVVPVPASRPVFKAIEPLVEDDEPEASDDEIDAEIAALTPPPAARTKPVWASPWMAVVIVALIGVTMGVTMLGRSGTAAPAASGAGTGTLEIGTSPDGVTVLIDGTSKGVTPLSVTLSPGAHVVELVSGSNRRTLPVTMNAGAHMSQFLEMPKAGAGSGDLLVRTDPAKATVTVDGQAYGRTPVTVRGLTPGSHKVVLENESGTFSDEVVIEAGATASLVVPMTKPQGGANVSGWIAINAPADLQVYEAGRLIGSSRSDRIMVAIGRHDLELVNEALGYRSARSVEVGAGQVASVKPDWPKGTMAVNALPWAEVFIDGERAGETPIGSVTAAIGSHEIVFRHPDLGERRTTATVTTGAPTKVSMDMRTK